MTTEGATATSGPYSDVIRARWRRPRFRGDLPDATAVAEDVNPLCGDRVRMMARIVDGRLAAVRFAGDACAICTASADVLAEMAEGQTIAGARAVTVDAVRAALAAEVRPTRLRCLTLPLAVLATALGGAPARP